MTRKSKSAFQGTDEGNHVVESQSFLLSLSAKANILF